MSSLHIGWRATPKPRQTGALRRVDDLVRRWFGTSLRADRLEPPIVVLGYQLFSALAGTLVDAKTDGSVLAVVVRSTSPTSLTTPRMRTTHGRSSTSSAGCWERASNGPWHRMDG